MKFRITMLVLLVTLLIGTVGSDAYAYNYNSNVVNKGRSYCPADGEFYTVAGSHKGHVKRSVPAPVVQERKYIPVKTEKTEINFFPIKAFVRIEQRPIRYRVIRQYSRYGNDRIYYNFSGRNYFRQWFGKSHHRRDHHERRRHRDRRRY